MFVRGQPDLFDLAEGVVGEPALDRAEEFAYLVRAAGSRDVDIAGMKPGDYQRFRQRASQTALSTFMGSELSNGSELSSLYGLVLLSEQEPEQPDQ